ncbi:MAG: GNAT family N-acetyltransferase [Candidatus Heimdallarchaeota archaeon]|nr:GNAT family N-acetyltransferase [Candidatus Heimdallarchaeota archaeon]
MSLSEDLNFFLKIAKNNLSRFCFMVWDYYFTPKIFQVEVIDSTLRCTYGQHNLIFGKINSDIIDNLDDKGDIVISFDLDWLPLIQQKFTDLRLLDSSWQDNDYNTFYCMELSRDNFQKKEVHSARRLLHEDEELVTLNRKIHLNSGVGGVGIVENNSINACAFAPHVVNNEDFSFSIIRDVWTRPSFRGRGLGYDVSSKICEASFEEDVDRIFLWVEEQNKVAIKIYEKIGFKVTDKAHSVIGKKNKSYTHK